ncbi:unnamed protein product [Linum trigynum]|uniref:Uncharacterized protein n=1 Tax=Linum trigynum TaxID=586398 RepID=A0AAV2E7J4_9ROSI
MHTSDLLSLDLEIEKTCRQNRKHVKLGKQPTTTTRPSLTKNRQQRGQVSPPVIPIPPTPPPLPCDIETVIMAEEDDSIRARLNRRTRARASTVVISDGDATMGITPTFINGIANGYTFSRAINEDPHQCSQKRDST